MTGLGLKTMKFGSNRVGAPLLWVLPIVLLVGLASMPKEEYPADPMAVRCETVSLINHGEIEVPSKIASALGDRGQFFFENSSKHRWYSKYGIMNDFVSLPPLLVEKWCLGQLPYLSPSRAIFLNFYNLILSLISAFYLCLIVSRYTQSSLVIIIFVLTAFYCTYWWNYLRAQNSEIYQTLFMLAFYYHLASYFRPVAFETNRTKKGPEEGQLVLAGIFLGSLILVKTVYLALLPLVIGWLFFLELRCSRPASKTSFGRRGGAVLRATRGLLIPVLCSVLALLAVNAYKFGSPFATGYEQWGDMNKPAFSGSFLIGLYKLLIDIQSSIFIYFPLLVFALFGYVRFFRRYLEETLLFLPGGIVLLLIYAKLLNPVGIWCYGPRYMLPILPLLSLPFVSTLECLLDHYRKWWAMSCLTIMALSFSYSCDLQLKVNALPFFTYFRLQTLFSQFHDPEVDRYFTSHHFGTINGDILAAKDGQPLPLLDRVTPRLDFRSASQLIENMDRMTPSNYYWWKNDGTLLLLNPKR